jgi:hypothetical protein
MLVEGGGRATGGRYREPDRDRDRDLDPDMP